MSVDGGRCVILSANYTGFLLGMVAVLVDGVCVGDVCV